MSTMTVISDQDLGVSPILNRIDSGPCLRGSGDSVSWCGNCGSILLEGVDTARVSGVVFRCQCGAYNRPD